MDSAHGEAWGEEAWGEAPTGYDSLLGDGTGVQLASPLAHRDGNMCVKRQFLDVESNSSHSTSKGPRSFFTCPHLTFVPRAAVV